MADLKNKNNESKAPVKDKPNRLAEAFSKDYKYEGLILLILAIIAIVFGVILLANIKQGNNFIAGAFLIGENDTTSKIFAWILIVLGAFSLALSIWPYYKPSIYEVRRVTWPTKKIMITNCLDVLVYSVSFAVFFFLVDILFAFIIKAL
ncbi:MAG: preprotein translocase subunit SecE [Bacilli bacterium]|nr:preprotein translocase subunit SecE [Bacilli bacterium]